MPPKRKTKKQPFLFFCEEQQQMRTELTGKALPQVIEFCGPLWAQMGIEERKPYANTAREYSEHGFCTGSVGPSVRFPKPDEVIGKFDSSGKSLRDLASKIQIRKYATALMEEDIRAMVEDRISDKDLLNSRFHILAVNSWCTTDLGDTYPAEIGLVEITLKDGIQSRYCQLLSPIKIPYGYSAEFKTRTEKVHQISKDSSQLSNNLDEIYEQLVQLLIARPGEHYAGQDVQVPGFDDVTFPPEFKQAKEHKLLPVYVMSSHITEISKALKTLSQTVKIDILIPLYDLPLLLSLLMSFSNGLVSTEMSRQLAEIYLSKDVFLYTRGICCSYHQKVDSPNCAGAKVTRLAFLLCDICSQAYDMDSAVGHQLRLSQSEPEKESLPSEDPYNNVQRISLQRAGEAESHPLSSFVTHGTLDQSDMQVTMLDPGRVLVTVPNIGEHTSFLSQVEKQVRSSFWNKPLIDASTDQSNFTQSFRTANGSSFGNPSVKSSHK